MLKRLFAISVILLTVFSISFAGSKLNMQEGKWEITSVTEMPGMPMNMGPMKHTQCITKKDLVPHSSQPGQECKITDTKITGDTVTWSMTCSGQGGKVQGSGKITYKGDSFEGESKMLIEQGNMEMTSHMSGKRIGNCD